MNPARRIRVSDAEREAVVARLGAATAEGRLTLEEFSDRSHRAYASRTHDELVRLVDDLPYVAVPLPPPAAPGSSLPTLALVFGVASIVLSPCVPFGALLAIAGVVLGVLGLRGAARRSAGGRGLAAAGVACGSLGIVIQVVMLMFFITVD